MSVYIIIKKGNFTGKSEYLDTAFTTLQCFGLVRIMGGSGILKEGCRWCDASSYKYNTFFSS